jgi:hypothetical protein
MEALPISRSTVRTLLAMGLAALGALTTPVVGPAVAAAQGRPPLAEVARKEAERRKTTKEAKRVITAKDLPESARKAASTPATAEGGADAATAAPAGPPGPPSNEQKPAAGADAASTDDKGEASWRGRITQAREGLRRNEVFLQAMQTRVNSLTNDAQSRSDPIQRAKLREDREKAIDEMERLKADIEGSKKQIADIEEEARKAGVPPGWLR